MNAVLEKILDLMNIKNISASQLQNDCNLSNNAVTLWKKRDTFPKDLQIIADYFDVSVDYLLGREVHILKPFDSLTSSVLDVCDKLSLENKAKLLAYAKGLSDAT